MSERGRRDLIDLRALTDRWRIRRDAEDLRVILGRHGHLSAHDRETLCVYIHGRRYVARVLRALPAGWRRHQIGDDEAILLVPVADLDRAARVVRAYTRRRLSPEHIAALARGRSRAETLSSVRFLTPESAGEGVGG